MPTGVEHGEVTFITNHVESVDEGGWALPAYGGGSPTSPSRRGPRRAPATRLDAAGGRRDRLGVGVGLWRNGAGAGSGAPRGDACGAVPQPGVSARSGRPGGAERATPRRPGRRSPRGAGGEHGAGCVALAPAGAPGCVAGPHGRAHRPGRADRAPLAARADRVDRPDGAAHCHRLCAGGTFPPLRLAAGRSDLAGPEAAAGAVLPRRRATRSGSS